MQEADQPKRRLHLDRQWHLREAFDVALLFGTRKVEKPAPACRAVHLQIDSATAQVGDGERLMVALYRVEPGLRQPVQRLLAGRPPVHQIAHAEQPIHPRIESHLVQASLQPLEMTMDVAHGQIAATVIGTHPPKTAHCFHPLLLSQRQA